MNRVPLRTVQQGGRFWLVPGLCAYEAGPRAVDTGAPDRMVSVRKLTPQGSPAESGWPRQVPESAQVWVEVVNG